MTAKRLETGRQGEERAAQYLAKAGYRILARNYRCPVGELDIIAQHDDTIVFVEVRTRRVPCMVRPEDTVNRTKARHVMRAAQYYLSTTSDDDRPWRVDVVAVEFDPAGKPLRLEHHQDAPADVMRHS